MSNKVNLAVPLRIPKVDSEDVEGCVNFTRFPDQDLEFEDMGTHT